MVRASEIIDQLRRDLNIDIPIANSQASDNPNYARFGNAAGVISAATLFCFLSENGTLINILYRSGKFVATNWDAIKLAWDTKDFLDISFVDAAASIHEIHNVLDLADAGDALSGLDLVEGVATAIDGATSFFAGYLVSKGVKAIGNKINGPKIERKQELEALIETKKQLIKGLRLRYPPSFVEQLYDSLPAEARSV